MDAVIFSTKDSRPMTGGGYNFLARTILSATAIIILSLFFPRIESKDGQIIVGFIIALFLIALVMSAPWISRFKKNVYATTTGIGYDEHFFLWSEVTKISSWYAGRIDIYTMKNGQRTIFCFGIPLTGEEFREGYKKTYNLLVDAREMYLKRSYIGGISNEGLSR